MGLLHYPFGFSLFRHLRVITFNFFHLLCLAKDHWWGFSTRNAHMAHIVNWIPIQNGAYIWVEVSFHINLRVIILASLLGFPMLGCRHSLLRISTVSRFPRVECTFPNVPNCEHWPAGAGWLIILFFWG